ncbi:diguanylate cyclase [Sulfurimonas sp.]|uniref:diguanylate cyclase n=1 Tax=Sulfurimonas sp. TaxID=2022749 RepID=UPI003562C7D0
MDNYTKEVSILYVEDEKDVRECYARALQNVSQNIFTASNGEEGLELYKKNKPDIVISDMNGLEMTKTIKEIDENANVIFTTTNRESAYLLEAIKLHVEGYLLKPVEKKLLLKIVKKLSRTIILEKENKEQRDILQHIIDSENNITLITDTNDISFASKSFFSFFGASTIEEFKHKFPILIDIFSNSDDLINKDNIIKSMKNNIDFYEFINNIDESSRVVTLKNKDNEEKSLYINISKINNTNYLINFTDITKLTQEKEATELKVYKDSLTGINNREKFEEVLYYELKQSKRYNRSLSLAILDIDKFKDFNDKYGHLIGDEVLIMLSESIQSHTRESDLFARWGGEEFVLLFSNTNLQNAMKLAENFRQIIENLKHKSAGSVTVSFGLTEYKKGDTMKSMFKRADDALYEAKNSGRNCIRSIT